MMTNRVFALVSCLLLLTVPIVAASRELRLKETVVAQVSPGAELVLARMAKGHIAWVEKQGGKRVVRIDGKQLGAAYDDVRYLHFNPNATKLAYAAKRNSKWILVIDGNESTEFAEDLSLVWNPKSDSYAYAGCPEKHKCALF